MTSTAGAAPATEPVAPTTARHWMVAAGAACLMLGGGFVVLSFSFLNPPMAETLGVGVSEVMIYNSLMSIAGALSMILLSPVAMRRLGARRTLLAGSCWTALMLLGFSYVGSPLAAYLLGLGLGLTFATCTGMMASVLVNTWFAANRGAVLGAVMAISGLAGVALGLVMPAVVSASGWQGGFRLLAALAVVFLLVPGLVLVRSRPEELGLRPAGEPLRHIAHDEPAVEVPGVPRGLALRTPQFAAVAVAMGLVMAVQAVLQHLVPVYLERGVDLVAAGSLVSVLSAAMIAATISVGVLNDRVSTLAALWVSLGAQAASMLALVVSVGYLPLAVSTVIYAVSATLPIVLTPIVVELAFGMRDFVGLLGAVLAATMLGQAIGTPLWGLVVDLTGSYRLGLLAAAALSVVSGLLLTWALRTAPALRARVEHDLHQGYRIEPTGASTAPPYPGQPRKHPE